MAFREHCTRCNREFVEVQTTNDMSKTLKTKKTYKLRETKAPIKTSRDYCGFCGAWIR